MDLRTARLLMLVALVVIIGVVAVAWFAGVLPG